MKKHKGGWPTIFKGKSYRRYQGNVTKPGAEAFEAKRQQLIRVSGLEHVSDGQVIEALARGDDEAAKAVQALRKSLKE